MFCLILFLLFLGCKEWKIWLVQRHGTRTPGKELDQFVKNRLPEIQKDIVNNLIECRYIIIIIYLVPR